MREMPESPPLYLSDVYQRGISQRFKMHNTIHTAKAALSYRQVFGVRGGKIWHWQFGKWELIYDVPANTRLADLPWKTPA